MRHLGTFASLAAAFMITACDQQATSPTVDPSGKGALALAFSASTLTQVRVDSDSLLLTLRGSRDTIRSLSRLGDTLRFDGLRTGAWSIEAQLFATDSGARSQHWSGSASALVEPGRVARVPLVLRRATGALVIDVILDTDAIDTVIDLRCPSPGGPDSGCLFTDIPTVPSGSDSDTTLVPPASDSPVVAEPPAATGPDSWPTAGLGFRIEDTLPGSWIFETKPYAMSPSHDTSTHVSAARILDWNSSTGVLRARVLLFGTNTVPWVSAPPAFGCGDSICPLPLTIEASPLEGVIRDSTTVRVVTLLVDLGDFPDIQRTGATVSDRSGYTGRVGGLRSDASRCVPDTTRGLVLCRDVTGASREYLPTR